MCAGRHISTSVHLSDQESTAVCLVAAILFVLNFLHVHEVGRLKRCFRCRVAGDGRQELTAMSPYIFKTRLGYSHRENRPELGLPCSSPAQHYLLQMLQENQDEVGTALEGTEQLHHFLVRVHVVGQ